MLLAASVTSIPREFPSGGAQPYGLHHHPHDHLSNSMPLANSGGAGLVHPYPQQLDNHHHHNNSFCDFEELISLDFIQFDDPESDSTPPPPAFSSLFSSSFFLYAGTPLRSDSPPATMPSEDVVRLLAVAAMENPAVNKRKPRRRRPRKRTRKATALNGCYWPRPQARETIWDQKLLFSLPMNK